MEDKLKILKAPSDLYWFLQLCSIAYPYETIFQIVTTYLYTNEYEKLHVQVDNYYSICSWFDNEGEINPYRDEIQHAIKLMEPAE